MKTELVDVNDTRKHLRVEIPRDVVDAEISRVALDYSRRARIPGFRPGKAPSRVIRQRFRDQILHDVAHDLIPRAVDDALRERGVETLDTPDIVDVTVEEGRALTFTASFDTLPAFDPGAFDTVALTRPSTAIEEAAVDQAMERLRDRAARLEPVDGRGVVEGDAVTLDVERRTQGGAGDPERHADVVVELGAAANPPGFDEALLGLEVGATKTFTTHYPADYAIAELAGTDVAYTVTVKGLRRRVRPALDDEFAKDLGEFETLEALRTRVRTDLEHEARHEADRAVRSGLMAELAGRLPFEVPPSLVEHEIDRRLEDFARRLMEQGVDPREANLDWAAFRQSQQTPARDAVASALVLDEVARREHIEVSDDELSAEIDRYAQRTGRTPQAVRAALEKERGLSRIKAGLRRDKAIDFVMARARIVGR
jgi:trigger factor